jgi:hypothetical protein
VAADEVPVSPTGPEPVPVESGVTAGVTDSGSGAGGTGIIDGAFGAFVFPFAFAFAAADDDGAELPLAAGWPEAACPGLLAG